jgi:hypothetical protein
LDAIAIVGIDHEDDTLRIPIVVAPQGSDSILATDIPDCEVDVAILDCFHLLLSQMELH